MIKKIFNIIKYKVHSCFCPFCNGHWNKFDEHGFEFPILNEVEIPFFDIDKIFLESELTTTLSTCLLFNAELIVHSTNGLPLNNLIFLFGIPFEPLLAGIKAKILLI